MEIEAIGLISLLVVMLAFIIINFKNKPLGRHLILVTSILGLVFVYLDTFTNSPESLFLIYAVISILGLLFMIPSNAKFHGKSGPLWASLTFVISFLAGIIFYFITLNKKEEANIKPESEDKSDDFS